MATPILMPRQGQSVESCVLVQWTIKPGDVVKEGDTIAQIETDKATFEVPAPASGTVLELFFPEGSDIPVLTNIGAIGAPGDDINSFRPGGVAPVAGGPPNPPATAVPNGKPPVVSLPASAPAPAPAPARTEEAVGVSPRARKLAAAQGVQASTLAGSGPGGRVLERDVQQAVASSAHLSPAARAAIAQGGGYAPGQGTGPGGMVLAGDLKSQISNSRSEIGNQKSEIPVKGIRKIVAERMRQSLAGTAQLTLTRSFDVTSMQRARAAAKERGEKLTINDLLCLGVVRTLAAHPALNAHFLGDRIVQFGSVNLGVAVDTPRGLMVPVVAGCERMSVQELSAAIKSRAEACQKGNINPDFLSGGTFTITNLGALGIETFTPVLNAPEVAILGVGGINIKPVRKDGAIALVDTITLSLTIDHQAVDGAPGARFLKDLCETLEKIEGVLA